MAQAVNILLVEDEESYIEAIGRILAGLPGSPAIDVARSKDAAERHLSERFFDLVVLDLKIPTEDGLLDADPQHGRSTFYAARDLAPGTPIFVLTGSPAEGFIEDFLRGSQLVDIWSEGQKIPTIQFLQKYRFDDFAPRIEQICRAVWNLSEVELFFPEQLQLPKPFDRLFRIFSKRVDGTRCEVRLIGGGLSSARVYRLRATGRDGSIIHDAIGKLGSMADIRSEGERFDTQVNRLDPAATPRKLFVLEFGAKDKGGVFYSLAANYALDGFSAVNSNPSIAATVSQRLPDLFAPWWQGVPEARHSVKEIRQKLLSDQDHSQLLLRFPLLWANEFEARHIQARWCCTHGDLHGKNVLIAQDGKSVVIDYGDVGFGTAATDPITYELSLIFHPNGAFRGTGWPTVSQALHWGDLDNYLEGCPAPNVVRQIRAWATRVAAGQREIAATAYAYLMRQFKYNDTDKALISALLSGVHNYFLAT